jgi:hypothetical protein
MELKNLETARCTFSAASPQARIATIGSMYLHRTVLTRIPLICHLPRLLFSACMACLSDLLVRTVLTFHVKFLQLIYTLLRFLLRETPVDTAVLT